MSTVPFRRERISPLPPDVSKRLPSNLDAERSILGAILLDNTALNTAINAGLQTDFFFLDEHRVIYLQMLELSASEQPIDLVTLTEILGPGAELDRAGGAAYISSLPDGMPKISSVEHYIKIIREKATLRNLIHLTHNIQQRAFEESDQSDLLIRNAVDSIEAVQRKSQDQNPAIVVGFREMLGLELPKANPLIDPVVTCGGTSMMYSWPGFGKSWVATEIAFRVAYGVPNIFAGHPGVGGHWPICEKMRTLMLYGEMHGDKIRERLILIAKGNKILPEDDSLGIMSKDYQRIPRAARSAHAWRPSIATAKDRKFIEDHLDAGGYRFLILDNISTLWSASQEEQSKQVATLKDWFIDLNAKGITVLFLQHAGKSGDFLGDSAQVHILDSLLKLEHGPDYKRQQGLRVIVKLDKIRYELREQSWAIPFEASLKTDPEEGAVWLTRPAKDAQMKAAFELFKTNMPPVYVGQEVGVSRATAYRWKDLYDQNTDATHWSEQED